MGCAIVVTLESLISSKGPVAKDPTCPQLIFAEWSLDLWPVDLGDLGWHHVAPWEEAARGLNYTSQELGVSWLGLLAQLQETVVRNGTNFI